MQVLLVISIVVILAVLAWEVSNLRLKKNIIYDTGQVCINKNCFEVELARDNFQIEKGLMFREKLEQDKGMLFVFNKEANYPFWMKNTKIPLDIIWINENEEIVYISEFTQPCKTFFCPKINPQKNAKYVLEINGGLSKKSNLKLGDKVEILN